MATQLKRLPGKTVELLLNLPSQDVQKTYDKILDSLLKEVEIQGFRKGKAPKELALKQINPQKVYEEALKELIPTFYAAAVKEHDLKPVIAPNIELLEAETGKDWKVRITTAERPDIKLKQYKTAIAKLYSNKKGEIWTPDKGAKPTEKKDAEVSVGQVLEALLGETEAEVSNLIVDQELNRMLSNLVSEIQKLGLTVDNYLASQGKTIEKLREEYKEQARKTIVLEFALEAVAEAEKVVVEDAEIETFINQAKTPVERENLEKQRYYIASVLRKQKTLSQLAKPPVVAAT